jgi:predicted amidohydrolase
MYIAAVQTLPVFGENDINVRRAIDMMAAVKSELYVLPELFHCGYQFQDRQELVNLAQSSDGSVCSALKEFSRENKCAIYAGIAELDGDKIYNSSLLIETGEIIGVYRKLHLFWDEKGLFDKAHTPLQIFTIQNQVHIGPMICFDWVFPELARALALQGAQILCNSANLVLPWCQRTMAARSLENGVFSVVCNRIGVEHRTKRELYFTGGSVILNHRGDVLARASTDRQEVICAEIDPSLANDKWLTPRNHLFHDLRPHLYNHYLPKNPE